MQAGVTIRSPRSPQKVQEAEAPSEGLVQGHSQKGKYVNTLRPSLYPHTPASPWVVRLPHDHPSPLLPPVPACGAASALQSNRSLPKSLEANGRELKKRASAPVAPREVTGSPALIEAGLVQPQLLFLQLGPNIPTRPPLLTGSELTVLRFAPPRPGPHNLCPRSPVPKTHPRCHSLPRSHPAPAEAQVEDTASSAWEAGRPSPLLACSPLSRSSGDGG